ncbi:MAG: DPP IV N-terminal domain-containing protein, partial [Longimicrobiales bacterium]
MRTLFLCCVLLLYVPQGARAQRLETPLHQSAVRTDATDARSLTLRDASRNDRWLGLGVRDVRWTPDGSGVYFRWNEAPDVDDVPLADPWYRVAADGRSVERVLDPAEVRAVPGPEVIWSADGRHAAWASGNSVYLHEGDETRPVATLTTAVESVRFAGSGALDAVSAQALYRYEIEGGSLALLAARHTVAANDTTAEGAWLARQQEAVFQHVRAQGMAAERAAAASRSTSSTQLIPTAAGKTLEALQMSPDGRYVTFKERAPATDRPSTQYIDYVDASGYSTVRSARAKTGEPRDVVRLGVLTVDPSTSPDSLQVTWVELPEAGDQRTIPHGPYWSSDGTRALVQFIGEDHKDVWFAELDVATGGATVLAHDHDEGWIGGPTVQANYLQPALLEWLPDGSWVFASERSGWSHLYRVDAGGEVTPLTSGEWEVRNARLNRDRDTWLLQASREHPSDDHLYRMPARGGDLVRLTDGVGRNEGWLSPDGDRIAVISSTATTLPDLFVGAMEASERGRVTVSGTDSFQNQRLSEPTIVSFPHPDGDPVWAALYAPETPHPDRPAVIHIHGGGYRQFAHRGWSVYGWALHVGFLNYLVQQGYTVLDFDYRGGAGFGRDYRTDVTGSMGIKD